MNIKKGLFVFGLCVVALLMEVIFYWAGLRSTYPLTVTQKIMMFLTVGTIVLGVAALIGGIVGHFAKKENLGEAIFALLLGGYCFGALIFAIQ